MTAAQQAINDAVSKVVNKYGPQFVTKIRQALQSKDKNATGALSQSIGFEVLTNSSDVTLHILALDYLKYVQLGRGPGGQPPVSSILEWVQARGITAPATVRRVQHTGKFARASFKFKSTAEGPSVLQQQTSLAWAIAKTIAKVGVKPTDILSNTNSVYGDMVIEATTAAAIAGNELVGSSFARRLFEKGINVKTTFN